VGNDKKVVSDPIFPAHNSPYGIAYYDGYKWRLECKNNDFGTITSKVTVMYGHGQ